jgi:aspartate aminotransferase-like enzyme
MKDISHNLKAVYNAHGVALIPGSGTFGMEAVARQFATNKDVMVIRNGWFSYRWSQIFEMGGIPAKEIVHKARTNSSASESAFAPAPINEVVASIKQHKPAVVFAPHVETSAGIMLPDSYLREVAKAVHEVGGLFVLDCIASGTVWVDMQATGVDVLISAPQKGWSASPCCALVMLSELATKRIETTTSSSFACDLKKWLQIMHAYENGGHAYHATMPTDSLMRFNSIMHEAKTYGFEKVCNEQTQLGKKVRALLAKKGFKSVAAQGFEAPSVVVCYTQDNEFQNGKKFAEVGLQIAAGVPLQCDEPKDFKTFRIGLFGLEKLHNLEHTLQKLEQALDQIAMVKEIS